MPTALRALLVEDSADDAELVLRELRKGGYVPTCHRVETVEALREALTREPWEVVLADYFLPQLTALSALEVVQQHDVDMPFIIVSGSVGEDLAVDAMKAGAHDYVMKDNLARLVPAVARETAEANVRRERRRAQAQLVHDALHDALTGLPNRALFIEVLIQSIARAQRRPDYEFAVLYLDLDRFKVINDSFGHLVGDRLLAAVAERLRAVVRSGDTVCRLGGDEFTILLDDLKDSADASRVAEKVRMALSRPFQLASTEVFTAASIGVVLGRTRYTNVEEVLRDADLALYRAKSTGRNRFEVFDTAMHRRAVLLMELEHRLRHAVEHGEFFVEYQPVVDVRSGELRGFEALVRWQYDGRGVVAPSEFIPVAEENGLIVPIGEWVLAQACGQMRQWVTAHGDGRDLTMSVNVSGRQFLQPGMSMRIEQILGDSMLAPTALRLEITESVMLETIETIPEVLNRLRELDVRLHIDDFGTGYSSLSSLERLPVDTLKIDRSFVSRIGREGNGLAIPRAIVTLAHSLGMDVIAEGVETVEQWVALREMGCEMAQGFLLSRPVGAAAAEAMLAIRDLRFMPQGPSEPLGGAGT